MSVKIFIHCREAEVEATNEEKLTIEKAIAIVIVIVIDIVIVMVVSVMEEMFQATK